MHCNRLKACVVANPKQYGRLRQLCPGLWQHQHTVRVCSFLVVGSAGPSTKSCTPAHSAGLATQHDCTAKYSQQTFSLSHMHACVHVLLSAWVTGMSQVEPHLCVLA